MDSAEEERKKQRRLRDRERYARNKALRQQDPALALKYELTLKRKREENARRRSSIVIRESDVITSHKKGEIVISVKSRYDEEGIMNLNHQPVHGPNSSCCSGRMQLIPCTVQPHCTASTLPPVY